ncbi:GNAT family N-acetyltransferase [Candidatus Pacearchaeota archaeon]|nr:GNAT family N-acetyltransferase [Candidatus Pacearchaeota archaeon]
MKIIKVNSKNKNIDKFTKSEWKKFNEERGYKYNEKKHSFAAFDNKKVAGFISFKINGGAAFISQLIVSRKLRNSGVGSILIKKFEQFARKHKCHIAYLETSERHREALKFYKKHNYKIIATLKNNKFHFNWYIMSKFLK